MLNKPTPARDQQFDMRRVQSNKAASNAMQTGTADWFSLGKNWRDIPDETGEYKRKGEITCPPFPVILHCPILWMEAGQWI